MGDRNKDAKRRIAAVVNPAIDEILKCGPRGARIEELRRDIESTSRDETGDASTAAREVETYHRNLFQQLTRDKGFRFHVIGGDSEGEPTTENPRGFPDAEFKAILPKLSEALNQSIEIAFDSSAPFKEREIQESLERSGHGYSDRDLRKVSGSLRVMLPVVVAVN